MMSLGSLLRSPNVIPRLQRHIIMPEPSSTIGLSEFESALIDYILAGEDVVLSRLRAQMQCLVGIKHEHTGVGEFIDFVFSPSIITLIDKPSFGVDDVKISVNDSSTTAGCRLYINEGIVYSLEIYAYGDVWPTLVSDFHLRYNDLKFEDP